MSLRMPARLALAAALALSFADRPAHSEPPLPSINLPIEDWTVVAYAKGFLQQAYAEIGTKDVRLVDPAQPSYPVPRQRCWIAAASLWRSA